VSGALVNELKKTFVLLLMFILVIFALEQIKIGDKSFIYFPSHFYFLIVLAVITTVTVPNLRWMNFGTLMFFWGAIFVIIAYFYLLRQGMEYLQVSVVEAVFLAVAIWIAYQLNVQMAASESIMSALASSTYPNHTLELANATRPVDTEMNRARRHSRPLSLVIVSPENIEPDVNQKAYHVLREDMLRQFVHARIGQIIAAQARETDVITRDHDGKFIVLCTETERDSAALMAKRIQATIAETMGANTTWSVAAFPEDALTFEDLVEKAKQGLSTL